jgi:hypothetical protein
MIGLSYRTPNGITPSTPRGSLPPTCSFAKRFGKNPKREQEEQKGSVIVFVSCPPRGYGSMVCTAHPSAPLRAGRRYVYGPGEKRSSARHARKLRGAPEWEWNPPGVTHPRPRAPCLPTRKKKVSTKKKLRDDRVAVAGGG